MIVKKYFARDSGRMTKKERRRRKMHDDLKNTGHYNKLKKNAQVVKW